MMFRIGSRKIQNRIIMITPTVTLPHMQKEDTFFA